MLCGGAAAQANNEGLTSATVVDINIPATTSQQNGYNVPGENAVGTPMATSSTAINYGAIAYASVSSSVDAMTAYATATQPLDGSISYAEARSQPTIDDFATVTGPEAIGTPVTLTLSMVVTGSYANPNPDLAATFAYAGDSLSWTDHTNGTSSNGALTGSNNGYGTALSPLVMSFNTAIGDSIELNYGLDAWVYVAGNSQLGGTETVSLQLAGLYANGNMPGVELLSLTGQPYATPTPSSFAALGIGVCGLLIRRRRA